MGPGRRSRGGGGGGGDGGGRELGATNPDVYLGAVDLEEGEDDAEAIVGVELVEVDAVDGAEGVGEGADGAREGLDLGGWWGGGGEGGTVSRGGGFSRGHEAGRERRGEEG